MALSVEAEFVHALSESSAGFDNPVKNLEAAGDELILLVDDDGKLKRTERDYYYFPGVLLAMKIFKLILSFLGSELQTTTLLASFGSVSRIQGTVWTASAHIITTSIGAGVLSLAWAMAQLGWLAGLVILLFCTFTAGYASTLLADCYRFPDPVLGKRNCSYMETVKVYLGDTIYKICGWILYLDLAAIGVGFTITTANSLVAIQKSNCHRKNGEDSECMFSYIPHMVGFGLVEIILSQLQNFHKLTWLSKFAAIMSFVYATIGISLSLAKIISGEGGTTFLAGVEKSSSMEKMWMMFIAAGDIAFACSYALVLFEIQDTLKSSPPENKVMKKAVLIGGSTMTAFFMMCASFGYAAFGNKTPENLLAGFGDEMPWAFWLLDLANFCIVLHIVGAFQVLCQPVFGIIELLASRRWPKSDFISKEKPVRLANMIFSINMFRLTWRTFFVVLATVIAMAMPFFTDMLALLGAIGYWPLIVYVPIEMHIVQNKIQKQSLRWLGLQLLSLLCLLLSLAAAAGSIYGLHKGLRAYKLFQVKE